MVLLIYWIQAGFEPSHKILIFSGSSFVLFKVSNSLLEQCFQQLSSHCRYNLIIASTWLRTCNLELQKNSMLINTKGILFCGLAFDNPLPPTMYPTHINFLNEPITLILKCSKSNRRRAYSRQEKWVALTILHDLTHLLFFPSNPSLLVTIICIHHFRFRA